MCRVQFDLSHYIWLVGEKLSEKLANVCDSVLVNFGEHRVGGTYFDLTAISGFWSPPRVAHLRVECFSEWLCITSITPSGIIETNFRGLSPERVMEEILNALRASISSVAPIPLSESEALSIVDTCWWEPVLNGSSIQYCLTLPHPLSDCAFPLTGICLSWRERPRPYIITTDPRRLRLVSIPDPL